MTHLDILLPFGLPPAALAGDLFRDATPDALPALATLVSRAGRRDESIADAPRALPHESWLARRFGMQERLQSGGSLPLARAAMRAFGLNADEDGTWFIVNPVHIHIARDHLVLTHPHDLDLATDDARALFEVAHGLFGEFGKTLVYGNATTWFARADDWPQLQTSSPEAASGHNIDIWTPRGEGERDWRKLQNEVQMHWFTDAVNARREATGMKVVNSIWLWAGTPAADDACATPAVAYSHVFHAGAGMRALGQLARGTQTAAAPVRTDADTAARVVDARPAHGLLLLDALLAPALRNDWGDWLAHLRTLESAWFAPLLQALQSGRLDRISLVASSDIDSDGHARIASFSATRLSLRKFWIKPTLLELRA